MPETSVRAHPRKGTRGVRQHSRTIAERKTVPHTRSIYNDDDEYQELLTERNRIKNKLKRYQDMLDRLEKEYESLELPESEWDKSLDKQEKVQWIIYDLEHELKKSEENVDKRESELKKIARNRKSRIEWLKRRGPLSGPNKWGLKSPQISTEKINDDYIIPMNRNLKYGFKRNPLEKPEKYPQFHASGSRMFTGGDQIMLSEIGRHRSYGRRTGHFGTGVYTFDNLERAKQYQRSPDGEIVTFNLNQNNFLPFITTDWDQGWALHDFGRELSRHSWDNLNDDEFPELELYNFAKKAGLHYNKDLARHSVDMAQRADAFHPMTYYMTALGYDGIYHKQEMGSSSDHGNVIYPHKIKEIYPNIEIKETT